MIRYVRAIMINIIMVEQPEHLNTTPVNLFFIYIYMYMFAGNY